MFIIEKPYISEYMVDTIINHDWAVLDNETIQNCGIEEDAFRLWPSEQAASNYLLQEYPLICSNSEFSADWILENLPQSNLSTFIKAFKDKISFRDTLKDLYPNFHYQSLEYLDINYIKKDELSFPLIVKPSIGTMGYGIRAIKSLEDWDSSIKTLHKEIATSKSLYPKNIADSTMILIEDFIEGEDFSIDAFYDRNGEPVILNIFRGMHAEENEIKCKLYYTSVSLMNEFMEKFNKLLKEIGERIGIKNFPINLEVKITSDGSIIPIEANPMQFSSWCSADITQYAWNFNIYEYYNDQVHPDWETILANAKQDVFYSSILRIPDDFPKSMIRSFDYDGFLSQYKNIYELRQVNYKDNPIFGIVLGSAPDENELFDILYLDIKPFIK